jgi:flagellar assembly protein FliH
MSEPGRIEGDGSHGTRRGPSGADGASWVPPSVAGPLITFRGKQASASALEDEARAAREAGFERGRSEGLAAAAVEAAARMAELDARRQLLEGLARQIAMPLERFDEETAAEMARLALTVGARLARRELTADPQQVMAIIRECLDVLPSAAREVRIRLNPRDASALREHLLPGGEAGSLQVVEDGRMSRGGCVIEAEASRIDAQFESRVAAAVVAVLGDEEDPTYPSERRS